MTIDEFKNYATNNGFTLLAYKSIVHPVTYQTLFIQTDITDINAVRFEMCYCVHNTFGDNNLILAILNVDNNINTLKLNYFHVDVCHINGNPSVILSYDKNYDDDSEEEEFFTDEMFYDISNDNKKTIEIYKKFSNI